MSDGRNIVLELRRFTTAYSDLPTMLENVNKLMRLLTLNIDSNYKEPIPIKYYILTAVTAAAYTYVYGVSASWFIIHRCLANGDVIRAIIVFSLCIASEIGNAKFLYIYFYRDIVRKIVEHSLNFDQAVIPNSRFSKNILKTMKKAKVRALVFWFIITGNGFLYVSKSLLTPGRHFMDDLYTIYGLEPIEKSPNYEIGYTLIVASVWFLCYVPANVTAFLIVVAGYIEAQMLALTEELIHVWPDAIQNYEDLNIESKVDVDKNRIVNDFVNMRLRI